MNYGVYKVSWVESEAGWGIRPDGVSLHATYDEGIDYIQHFLEEQKRFFQEKYGDKTPPEYTKPANDKPEFVKVDEDIAEHVERKRNVSYSPSTARQEGLS